ncbi:MAG: hypothetical protein ACFFG0_02525 [Candidatus Thorarchaeota archaeon]
MLRWNTVDDKEIFDLVFKMYRDMYVASETFASNYEKIELDHQAYKYLQTELHMYRILDINFVRYIEERGDIDRIEAIYIPSVEDTLTTVL